MCPATNIEEEPSVESPVLFWYKVVLLISLCRKWPDEPARYPFDFYNVSEFGH